MSRQTDRIAKGKITTTAVDQRKSASVTGGTEPARMRATIKLPDQIAVAANTST
jgi:hypothetical protein